jgi:hypothetical protein
MMLVEGGIYIIAGGKRLIAGCRKKSINTKTKKS